MNSHRFKLYRAYSISFTSSNVGKCFWSWILNNSIKVQEKKRKLLSCVPVLDKTWIQALSRCSRATTAKKCTNKAWYVQSCCFANQTYCFFWRSRCRPRRRCLSSLMSLLKGGGSPPKNDRLWGAGGGGMRKNEDWVGGAMVIRNRGSKNSTSLPYLVKNERSLMQHFKGLNLLSWNLFEFP